MKRHELEHIIRAATQIADEHKSAQVVLQFNVFDINSYPRGSDAAGERMPP